MVRILYEAEAPPNPGGVSFLQHPLIFLGTPHYGADRSIGYEALNESGEIVMALSGLSPMQRAAPRVNFDIDRVRTLIAEYIGADAKRVTDEARFSDDLGLDWLDRLELMILIEDEFAEIEISERDATQIEVVGDLIRMLRS
jgi:acyl carrier protein